MSEYIAQRQVETKPDLISTSPTETSSVPIETVTTPEYTEKPPSISDEPYINKILEIGDAKDHFEMPTLINEINEFVLAEIKRNKMVDNNENYKEIINKYLRKLNLPDGIDIYTKIEKINELIKIDKKLIDAVMEKEELLRKSIEELTSHQLKARIEGKI